MAGVLTTILGCVLAGVAFGQAGVKFDVASVRPAVWQPSVGGGPGQRGTGGGCPTRMKVDGARVDFQCVTLAMLIGYAFRISPDRVKGPDWMMSVGTPRFEIVATIPEGASKAQVPEMFQALLAERFRLAVHRGTTNQPVYALVVARGGLKIRPAASGGESEAAPDDADGYYGTTQSSTVDSVTTIRNPRMGAVRQTGDPYQVQRWEAGNISMAGLADLIDHVAPLSSPVIDMTGLRGRYQLVLEVSLSDLPAARATGAPVDFPESVQKAFNEGLLKLGLRLELRKGPLDILVVDRVEKTPTEN